MNDVPLRSVSISDFRRLEGHRRLPLDAPIVLLHGPNGTGKTSVLSAIELALTGEIRSMRRHDARYIAHLPFHGQDYATLSVDVSEKIAATSDPVKMTVGGSRIDGAPKLAGEIAEFYSERCYLDQVSLGRLLELYQYREGKEESALARFVNELLGLEQLDALRLGLADSLDFRRLKKLSESLFDADAEAKQADGALLSATRALEVARSELAQSEQALRTALASLGHDFQDDSREELVPYAGDVLDSVRPTDSRLAALKDHQVLTVLSGRVEELSNWPAVRHLEEARVVVAAASAKIEGWRNEHLSSIEAWRADVAELQLEITDSDFEALQSELERINRTMATQARMSAQRMQIQEVLAERRAALSDLQERFSVAQVETSTLVEGLAALRGAASDNVCPVCDRNFVEVSTRHLVVHIDNKLAELTKRGERLSELRERRNVAATEVQRSERELNEISVGLLSDAARIGLEARRRSVAELLQRHEVLLPVMRTGEDLRAQFRTAQAELKDLQAAANATASIRADLDRLARALGVPTIDPRQSLRQSWEVLSEVSADRLRRTESLLQRHETATAYLTQCREATQRVSSTADVLTQSAERKTSWDRRVAEARRLQAIARTVHEASSAARSAIVHRVFSEELNEVWRSVFTRLAPKEPFVPTFGIPTSTKTSLELSLETVHASGAPGGSPQMMLSAGNLNTAALSLFIALHLAVEPLVPCLVFDDPVQSMDEVHISQFAALMRTLAKHHQRQVIIAVHERELFEYLALELSPAFQGDELITIELGDRSKDEDGGVTRVTWEPDQSIAV